MPMMASDPDAGEFLLGYFLGRSKRIGANLCCPKGVPNLNLTPEEKRVYGQLFRAADTEAVGVITGEVAVKFFERTKLDSRVLGEVSFVEYTAVRQ